MQQKRAKLIIFLLAFLMPLSTTAFTKSSMDDLPSDLTELSIEELADLEVTSVSKKPKKISRSAAAVYVITSEDIRRSGATSIPEVLRMAPGLDVARIDANKWAVSSRNFNSAYTNKLLVLIDGRTIYSPLFSGVFWQSQDTLLEDIERIEVIRGPGASLWGANAVNGIINIITKHTKDTKGGFVSTGFGTEERAFINTRYGDEYRYKGTYRVYAKGFIRDESVDIDNSPAGDDCYKIQAGFRTDQIRLEQDEITLQGDIHKEMLNENSTFPSFSPPDYSEFRTTENPYSGGNVLCKWQHKFRKSDMGLQLYYDNTNVTSHGFSWHVDTIDTDFQHQFIYGQRHQIIWGWGYRFSHDKIDPATFMTLVPESETHHLFSSFLQDEFTLIEGHLFLTLGSKLEHNAYTGYEHQPNARILLALDDTHTFWGAVSRATRSPSRFERSIQATSAIFSPLFEGDQAPFLNVFSYEGNENFESENLIAHELGYRFQLNTDFLFDLAVFYNLYDDLTSLTLKDISFETSPQRSIITYEFNNVIKGSTNGCEFAFWWKPADPLKFQTAYTYIDIDLKPKKGVENGVYILTPGTSPAHQVSFITSVNLPWHLECDLWLRYVDDIYDGLIEDYKTMDARVSWKPVKSMSYTIVGQNLLDRYHTEFLEETGTLPLTQVERSIYAKITWTF